MEDKKQKSQKELGLLAMIPTFNEEKVISKTIEALKSIPEVSEVLVADDCSTDKTVEKAEQESITVIKHPKNFGKGLSLTKALKQVDISKFNGIIFADGDLGSTAEQFKYLIKSFKVGTKQLIIAGFGEPAKKGGFGLVKGLARWAINKHGGKKLTTPLSGQRLISTEGIEAIMPLASGFGVEVDMTIKALRNGISVREVPTTMSHNETGRDLKGFIHRGRQFRDVLKVVISHW